jgi:hypothetical protein
LFLTYQMYSGPMTLQWGHVHLNVGTSRPQPPVLSEIPGPVSRNCARKLKSLTPRNPYNEKAE